MENNQAGSGDSGIGTHLGGDVCDNRSIVATSYSHWDTMSDKDSVSLQVVFSDLLPIRVILLHSLQAHSMAASQVERTLSEVASSLSAGIPKYNPHDAAYAQIR